MISLPGTLAVDARMLFNSGIGTVIRHVLSHWHETKCSLQPHLLVPGMAGMEWAAEHCPTFSRFRVDVPIYSLREQLSIPSRTWKSKVLWSPHFNLPLAAISREVVTIHDVLHLAHPEFFPGTIKQLYAKGMLAGAVRKARRIIAVSHFTASELVRHTGVDSSKITVVHNGVSPRWFKIPEGASPRPRPYFLFVGNIKPHKNLVRLIRAFAQIADSLPEYDLVIVGKKDGLITVDFDSVQLAEAYGERILFTGFLPQDVLDQYVTHAEALVYPSIYEGFGLPPLEAMAAGCPVIASDIPALLESCGDAALYCEPNSSESIAGALKDISMLNSEKRAQQIAIGRLRANQYTWEKTAQKTLAVIEEAAA